MATIASRELRNNTRAVLDLVDAGQTVVITVDGRPVANLVPLGQRPTSLSRAEFTERFVARPADAGLRDELRALAPDTTDDLPLT